MGARRQCTVLGEALENFSFDETIDYRLVKNPLTFACLKLSLSLINLTRWNFKK